MSANINRIAAQKRRYRRTLGLLAFFALLLFVAAGVLYFLRDKDGDPSPSADSSSSGGADVSQASPSSGESGQTGSPASAQSGEGTTSQPAAPAVDKTAWNLTLVNSTHPIEEQQIDLVAVDKAGHKFDARAADALMAMLADGNATGLKLMVCSAHRTVAYQKTQFDLQVQVWLKKGYSQAQAEEKAATIVALPGTSEHNLGLAADIVSVNYQSLDDGFADTPEFAWLYAHCADYGFVLRYPLDKTAVTGVIYEPWHYRYVGKEAARAIMDGGLCLEEYLGET